MRTFGTILALLLIFFGLVVAGLVVVRVWQDNGRVAVDANAAAMTSAATGGDAAGAGGGIVTGVETGGMALAAPTPAALNAVGVMAAPQDAPATPFPVEEPTLLPAPLPTLDPCPPVVAQGYPVDTAVVAVGMLRIYSFTDVAAPTLGELSAGQGLWIVAGGEGTTAVQRCELIWHRVRTNEGITGWVLDDAIGIVTPTFVPTILPLPSAVPTLSPCVGGCPTPCVQPCPLPDPCYQPCPQPTPCYQPCPTPCYEPCGGLG
jgi:hypothetical protein